MRIALPAMLTLCCSVAFADEPVPARAQVNLQTSEGVIVLELDGRRAPVTVRNFLALVDAGHYDGTIFHRVIADFMIQGGGYTRSFEERETGEAIHNESGNGLRNLRGTVAMARTGDPHSAQAQFYINVVDNAALDPRPDRWGYTVFGQVIEGMDVVDRIAASPTGPGGDFAQDVPVVPVIVEKATRAGSAR